MRQFGVQIFQLTPNACWEVFMLLLLSAEFFQNNFFLKKKKNLSGTLSECQTVCKGYWQMTKSLLAKKELNMTNTVKTLYSDILYNSKILYNVHCICTNVPV